MTNADVFADVEFRDLTGPQLVEAYNEMLHTWRDMGGDNRYGTVRRFSTPDNGRRRCLAIHAAIMERRGTTPAPASEPPRARRGHRRC